MNKGTNMIQKSRWMMVICLSFIICLSFSPVRAQSLTVNVDSVGKLAGKLPDDIRYSMSELKICGPLNGSDLRIVQVQWS